MTLFHKRTVKWYKQMCVCTTNFSLGLSHVQSVENSIRKAASSNLYTVRNTNTCHSSAEQVHKIRTLTYTHTNAHSHMYAHRKTHPILFSTVTPYEADVLVCLKLPPTHWSREITRQHEHTHTHSCRWRQNSVGVCPLKQSSNDDGKAE